MSRKSSPRHVTCKHRFSLARDVRLDNNNISFLCIRNLKWSILNSLRCIFIFVLRTWDIQNIFANIRMKLFFAGKTAKTPKPQKPQRVRNVGKYLLNPYTFGGTTNENYKKKYLNVAFVPTVYYE